MRICNDQIKKIQHEEQENEKHKRHCDELSSDLDLSQKYKMMLQFSMKLI